MFVDADLTLALPAGLVVPADAVMNSGLRQTIYVERESGAFEPRVVETGWRFGDRVQILKGLEAGERIVVAGNFLLDSEARMKAASIAPRVSSDETASLKDDVCGMHIDPAKAAFKTEYRGKTRYFCSKGCKEKFDKAPEKYSGQQAVEYRVRTHA
jgi:YHS domain-containing protein